MPDDERGQGGGGGGGGGGGILAEVNWLRRQLLLVSSAPAPPAPARARAGGDTSAPTHHLLDAVDTQRELALLEAAQGRRAFLLLRERVAWEEDARGRLAAQQQLIAVLQAELAGLRGGGFAVTVAPQQQRVLVRQLEMCHEELAARDGHIRALQQRMEQEVRESVAAVKNKEMLEEMVEAAQEEAMARCNELEGMRALVEELVRDQGAAAALVGALSEQLGRIQGQLAAVLGAARVRDHQDRTRQQAMCHVERELKYLHQELASSIARCAELRTLEEPRAREEALGQHVQQYLEHELRLVQDQYLEAREQLQRAAERERAMASDIQALQQGLEAGRQRVLASHVASSQDGEPPAAGRGGGVRAPCSAASPRPTGACEPEAPPGQGRSRVGDALTPSMPPPSYMHSRAGIRGTGAPPGEDRSSVNATPARPPQRAAAAGAPVEPSETAGDAANTRHWKGVEVGQSGGAARGKEGRQAGRAGLRKREAPARCKTELCDGASHALENRVAGPSHLHECKAVVWDEANESPQGEVCGEDANVAKKQGACSVPRGPTVKGIRPAIDIVGVENLHPNVEAKVHKSLAPKRPVPSSGGRSSLDTGAGEALRERSRNKEIHQRGMEALLERAQALLARGHQRL